jgi:rubrerythrin
MLAGKGFDNVYNLAGGIRGWQGHAAIGSEELGMEMFTGNEPPAKTLVIAYALESGLGDFYRSMIPVVTSTEVKGLFEKLAEIEIRHQERVFQEYIKVSGRSVDRDDFEKTAVSDAVEGGLTTEAYTAMFKPDWESATDVVSLAMSIEAQALDLYKRAADRADDLESQAILNQIATEEKAHLKQLGAIMDRIAQ